MLNELNHEYLIKNMNYEMHLNVNDVLQMGLNV